MPEKTGAILVTKKIKNNYVLQATDDMICYLKVQVV